MSKWYDSFNSSEMHELMEIMLIKPSVAKLIGLLNERDARDAELAVMAAPEVNGAVMPYDFELLRRFTKYSKG